MEFQNIGAKLRDARLTKRMRLKDVAREADCSESLLSKIERERVMPSLRILHRVANVLETSISQLFAEQQGEPVHIMRADKRPTIVLGDGGSGPSIKLERLAPHYEDKIIDGNIHVIAPGAWNGGTIRHAGQEIGVLIEGGIELTVGDQTFTLSTGDSFFFHSTLPHSYRNPGDVVAKIVWVNTPPTF